MAPLRITAPGLAVLLACGAPDQPTPTPTAAPAIAASVVPADTPNQQADAGVPAPPVAAAIAAPEHADTAPVVPTDATFRVAAYRDGELALHVLDDRVFVRGAGGLAHLDDRGRLVHVEYGLSGQAAPWLDLDGWQVRAFGGRWPDDAWLVSEYVSGRSQSPPQVHRRDGSAWKQQANRAGPLFWYYEAVLTWHSGQVLGLRADTYDPDLGVFDEDFPPRKREKIEARLAAARRGFDLLGPVPKPTAMVLDRGLEAVLAVAAAPTGELFALGRLADGSEARVQRWGLTGAAAVDVLPAGLMCAALAVRSADEVYAGCVRGREDARTAVVRRFDGAAWTDVPAPTGVAILRLSIAASGELWAVVVSDRESDEQPNELWRRDTRDAAWQRVPLPALKFPDRAAADLVYEPDLSGRYKVVPGDVDEATRDWPLEPTDVLARGAGDVWVTAGTALQRQLNGHVGGREVVLRTTGSGEPLRLLDDDALVREAIDWRPAPAWKPGDEPCPGDPTTFVVLRTLPANAPRDQPEPALEAFVRDNPGLLAAVEDLVEVHRRGRRAIGMFVALPDQRAADALLAALEHAAPGERRTLECRRPRVRRLFDKQTGKPLDPAVP